MARFDPDGTAGRARKMALVGDIVAALRLGLPVVMAHECDEGTKPDACVPFRHFFVQGQTPRTLINAGLYDDIAVSMQGGEHRRVSLALLGGNLVKALATGRAPQPDLEVDTGEMAYRHTQRASHARRDARSGADPQALPRPSQRRTTGAVLPVPSPARLPSEGTAGRIRQPSAGGAALDRLSKFTGSLTNLFAERPSAG